MLERDYIMRLIRQFFEALEKLKEKRDINDGTSIQVETNNMYTSYFHQPEAFFYEAGSDIIIGYMQARFSEKEYMQRIELLAELLYFDSTIKTSKEQQRMLWEKVLDLLTFLDTHSDTFSFDRRRKMEDIKALLNPWKSKNILFQQKNMFFPLKIPIS